MACRCSGPPAPAQTNCILLHPHTCTHSSTPVHMVCVVAGHCRGLQPKEMEAFYTLRFLKTRGDRLKVGAPCSSFPLPQPPFCEAVALLGSTSTLI